MSSGIKAVAFDDIQAIVRFGCGHLPESHFLLLSIRNRQAAGQWLQATRFQSAEKQATRPDAVSQIAFSASGLQKLGLAQETLEQFSDEFIQGMSQDENRSRRLGDVGHNAPEHWYWGHTDHNDIHVLLLLYSARDNTASHQSTVLNDTFHEAFGILHTLPTATLNKREPFGFIDGISQPDIDWEQHQSTNAHDRDEYSNLLAPGEVVLGYPNEYGQITPRPTLTSTSTSPTSKTAKALNESPLQDFGGNGTYLVIRQLEQHVHRFWQFMQAQSADDKNQADALAAAMVGRQRDGSPLVDANGLNDFTYDDDPHGVQCPISSHIRRSNPRSGDFPPGVTGRIDRLLKALGFKRKSPYEDLVASTRFHRLLRRGRTYGNDHSNDTTSSQAPQGLQFICLAGNIIRQFEFVQAAWSTSSAFAGLREQRDPLIGHRLPRICGSHTDSFLQATEQGVQQKTHALPDFVTLRGGGYFFLPGLSAIRFLAQQAIKPDVQP